jgi:hypothetical protein
MVDDARPSRLLHHCCSGLTRLHLLVLDLDCVWKAAPTPIHSGVSKVHGHSGGLTGMTWLAVSKQGWLDSLACFCRWLSGVLIARTSILLVRFVLSSITSKYCIQVLASASLSNLSPADPAAGTTLSRLFTKSPRNAMSRFASVRY